MASKIWRSNLDPRLKLGPLTAFTLSEGLLYSPLYIFVRLEYFYIFIFKFKRN